jgi:hypothetical protein
MKRYGNQSLALLFFLTVVGGMLLSGCSEEEDAAAGPGFVVPADVANDGSADTALDGDTALLDGQDSSDSDAEVGPDGDAGQSVDGAADDAAADSQADVADVADVDPQDAVMDGNTDTGGSGAACTGEDDQAQLMSWAESAIYKWVMVTAQECFMLVGGRPGKVIEDEEFHACVAAAVSTTLEVSGSCSVCFGDLAVCSKNFCLASCGAADPDIEENLQGCIDCQIENYCTHGFDECTGIDSES